MTGRADTLNRVLLFLLGLLLAAAGALGLALSLGAFGASRATGPVLPQDLHSFPEGRPWFWWAAAGVAVLVALLSLLWLRAQLRTSRVSRIDRTTDPTEGYTTIHASALSDAVEDEARGMAGVTGASARVHDHPRLGLALAVSMTDTADIDRLRNQLETELVGHLREAVADPEFPVRIELRPDVRRTPARTVA